MSSKPDHPAPEGKTMGYNRAHQLNIDNQSPPEGDFCDETWAEACESVASADPELIEILAAPDTEFALVDALKGAPSLPFGFRARIASLIAAARLTNAAVQSRYDALMANGGRP